MALHDFNWQSSLTGSYKRPEVHENFHFVYQQEACVQTELRGVSMRCKEVLLIITNSRAGGEGRDGEQMCPPNHPAVGLFYL